MRIFLLSSILFLCLSLQAQKTSYLCAGSPALDISEDGSAGGTPPYTYAWSGPGGFTATTQTISVSTAGVYQLTVTDATGCSGVANHTLIVEADPTAGITINAVNSCLGAAQLVSATGVPAGYAYSWNFGSGATPATSTTASTSVSWSTSGSKTITLNISKSFDGTGCDATCNWEKTLNITIGSIVGSTSCE